MSAAPALHMTFQSTMPRGDPERESSIDFARGAAMLLVFLAHFSQELTIGPPATGVPLLLQQIGMVASPTFVLVSGLTLAFVLGRVRPQGLLQAQMRVLDRAVFILVVTHVVLVISDVLLAPYQRGLRQFFITDMVALNLMIGLVLLPRTRPATRLAIGGVLYAAGWITHVFLHPTGLGLAAVAEEILTGPTARHALDYGFPVLEWAGVFLVGTALGQTLVAARAPEARRAWGLSLLQGGATAVAVAVSIKALLVVPALHAWVAGRPDVREILSLFGKAPPSPVYLMFFGGIGASLVGAATLLSLYGMAARTTAWVAVLGRNSLFVFMLQSAVFRDLIARLPLEGHPFVWPFAFVAATLFIWSGALLWDRLRGNRWLTLGIGQVVATSPLPARHS
jgi:uncharacterized membrane protein